MITNITDLDTPALLVDLDIMEANIARAAKTCRDAGVAWRPHFSARRPRKSSRKSSPPAPPAPPAPSSARPRSWPPPASPTS